jgi:hypothetical protein
LGVKGLLSLLEQRGMGDSQLPHFHCVGSSHCSCIRGLRTVSLVYNGLWVQFALRIVRSPFSFRLPRELKKRKASKPSAFPALPSSTAVQVRSLDSVLGSGYACWYVAFNTTPKYSSPARMRRLELHWHTDSLTWWVAASSIGSFRQNWPL